MQKAMAKSVLAGAAVLFILLPVFFGCANDNGGDATGIDAPVLSAGILNRTSDTAADIGFTTEWDGTAYYIVAEKNADAPANTAVRSGTSLGAVVSGSVSGKTVTLTAGEKYVYVVVQDSMGNTSAPLKIAAPAHDAHVLYVNSFIGVWETGGEYWEFRTDGTGGRANTQEGPFPDDFSFIYFDRDSTSSGSDMTQMQSLLILEGSPVTVTCYEYEFEDNQAILTQYEPEAGTNIGGAFDYVDTPPITLTAVNVSAQTLNLTNMLIGEWSATWSLSGVWSFRYRADGTVKVYHNTASHQFENVYALRENTLVLFGRWRFMNPTIADLSYSEETGKWTLTERQTSPTPYIYTYTKVDFATWKP